jgi:hypothetical protein
MTNTKCLKGVRCPRCFNEDMFRIEITATAMVTDHGLEVQDGLYEWGPESFTRCGLCAHSGEFSHFRVTRSK